ncbi:hypothetical protein WJX74_006108 [Apatococcus lobatus]|uniref:Peptidase S59 domain-containing protein n=1 Tax=Apatococcus lobatus TaxID=904363 RepID=A0AAW1RD66_9CHLO
MSFGGFGFGQSQASQSPFGAAASSPLRPAGSPFGQPASPFGASTGGGLFGAQTPSFGASAPAFGASTPAFGAASTPAFGGSSSFGFGSPSSNPFGASQPAFGAASTPAFGAASTPAFGAASTPAFGASPFGGGGSAFGTPASTPAFGAASTPAFGASPGAFGGFGQSGMAFGTGQPQAAPRGTRAIPFAKTKETEQAGVAGNSKVTQPGEFMSITAMPAYQGKCFEELRMEDYQDGCKGAGTGAPVGFGQAGSSPFGTPAAGPSPFGTPASQPAFGMGGSSGGFGSSSPAFGQTQSSFGNLGFGQQSTPAFGMSQPAFGSSGFGASSAASPFGTPAPAFGQGGAFGGTSFGSTPAFGASSAAAAFGTSTPAFGGGGAFGGGFGASSTPAPFGQSSTPAFGGGGLFGSQPQSSPSLFGSTPSFAPSGGFGFGQTPAQSTPSPFGPQTTGSSPFGSSPSPFGGGNLFGNQQAGAGQSKPFTFAPSSGSLFGQSSSPSLFGQTGAGGGLFGNTPAGGNLFGQQSSPAGGNLFGSSPAPFGGGGNLFGQPQSQAAPFGTGLFNNTGGAFGGGNLFGQPQQQQQQPQQQQQHALALQAPGINTNPYGAMPAAPTIGGPGSIPEARSGIALRPVAPITAPRIPALLTPRSIAPASLLPGSRQRSSRSSSALFSRASGGPGQTPPKTPPKPLFGDAAGSDGNADQATTPDTGIFIARDNPRRFFVRDPLPSTQSAQSSQPSPGPQANGSNAGNRDRSPGPDGDHQSPQHEQQEAGHSAQRSDTQDGAGPSRPAEDDPAEDCKRSPSPRSSSKPGKGLTDDQISALLPKLEQEDYYMSPSPAQLAAMARSEPHSLAHVANFTIGRQRMGKIRWIEPVDVRRLDLDSTVRFSKDTCEVYLDEASKPDEGEGLNTTAEVELHRIFRLDKATGKPTTDPEQQQKFARRLRKTTAGQGAEFLSYDPATGIWRFRVEHFSRYGLVGSDSEEEAEAEPLPQRLTAEAKGKAAMFPAAKSAQTPSRPAQRGFTAAALQISESDDDAELMEGAGATSPTSGIAVIQEKPGHAMSMVNSAVLDGSAQERDDMQDGEEIHFEPEQHTPIFQVALPTSLNVSPQDLGDLHADLYGPRTASPAFPGMAHSPQRASSGKYSGKYSRAGRARQGEQASSRLQKDSRAASTGFQTPQSASAAAPMEAEEDEDDGIEDGSFKDRRDPAGAGPSVMGSLDPLMPTQAPNLWVPTAPAISLEEPAGMRPSQPDREQGLFSRSVAAAGGFSALQQAADAAAQEMEAPSMVDASLLLGRSFRAGWGPHCSFVQPCAPHRKQDPGQLPSVGQTGLSFKQLQITPLLDSSSPSPPLQDTQLSLGSPSQSVLRLSPAKPQSQASSVPVAASSSVAGASGTGQGSRNPERAAQLEAMLALHMEHSGPSAEPATETDEFGMAEDDAAEDYLNAESEKREQVCRWALSCQRDGELETICSQYHSLAERGAAGLQQGNALELQRACLKQEQQTWHLLDVLFSHIPGCETALPQPSTSAVEDVAMEQDAAEESATSQQQLELDHEQLQSKRRARLSHWLQEAVCVECREGLRHAPSIFSKLAQLLSGHQLHAATALAAASGNVRLATQISQAGQRVQAGVEAGQQLDLWTERDCIAHIPAELQCIYRLLQGHADEVTFDLGLDWRRAFGLHLWFKTPTIAPFSAALDSYVESTSSGYAPHPLPLHKELVPGGMPSDDKPMDVHFELLCLAQVEWEANGSAAGSETNLERLLLPSGMRPDRLDVALSWHLHSLLAAIHALPPNAAAYQVSVLHTAFIAQLDVVGVRPQWQLYVAQHLPDGSAGFQGQRTQLLQELLLLHGPTFARDPKACESLVDKLGIPKAWLAASLAICSRYSWQPEEEYGHLIEAGDIAAAHELLAQRIAPSLFCSQHQPSLQRLEALLSQLHTYEGAAALQGATTPWRVGAGLYFSHLSLKRLFLEGTDQCGDPAAWDDRCAAHSHQLQDAAAWAAAANAALTCKLQVVVAMMAAQLLQWRSTDAPDMTECAFASVPTLSMVAPHTCAEPLQSAACSLAEALG